MDVDFIIHKLTKYINEPLDCTTRNVYCSLFECFIKKKGHYKEYKEFVLLKDAQLLQDPQNNPDNFVYHNQ